jgi:PAT family beta-lactamase induction signal transducer AmpG
LAASPPLLRSKLFWVGILYFAQGFPFGIFYDVIPVHFRQLGVDLREIGLLALVGLAWTIKFLWAPAVDHYRHHRRWMLAVDLAMGGCLLWLAMQAGFGPAVWIAIALFTLLSATNDIAIDGYTIEYLDQRELGIANGVRIALARAGILTAGLVLILSDFLGWSGAYVAAALLLAALGFACLAAPREAAAGARKPLTLAAELAGIVRSPRAFGLVLLFALATLWLVNNVTRWSATFEHFWAWAFGGAAMLYAIGLLSGARTEATPAGTNRLTQGPMFGALMEMLARPYILPVIAFVLIFKLGDASMGFMVKPFWVDSGFTATQIGVVSVNIGLILSIAGGIAGGWFTDRVGIFRALWILGLFQALSNLGYVWAANTIPAGAPGVAPLPEYQWLMYSASALESFTSGLGTAAFLAFLMAIVNKEHAATEYAILSSIFALSRQLAGYASGFGAHHMGYADYFLLTFFLAFPAYLLLPWVSKMLGSTTAKS